MFAVSTSVSATEVVINDASAYPSNITFTDITIKNVTNVGVIDLNLYYNPSVVIVTDVKDSDFEAIIPNLEESFTGFIRIGAFQIENPGLNGSVVIANLTLKAVGDPGSTSPLNIIVNELKDATFQGNDIPYTVTNGTSTITSAIDNVPPVITITFPINGSTHSILNNSVIVCISDESELTVAKLTLNDDFVTTLNKGCFNVKVNYRANETNIIEVFARDKEGNANVSQVMVNVLPNIVVVNKTAIANQTMKITEAKNATNTVIEINATKAANVSVTINANTNASALNVTPATYGLAQNLHSLDKYVKVTLNHFSTFALVAEKIPAPVTSTPTPLPEGGGVFLATPLQTSTLTPTLIATEAPTLAPTVTPLATPTAPTIPTPPPVPVSVIKWLIIAIAIVASVIIMSAVYCYHRMQDEKR